MRLERYLGFTNIVAALLAATIAVCPAAELAQMPAGPFTIKPSDVHVPVGIKRGAYRRIIQPFGPWSLICDENLASRKRVCNVSQTIVDATGRTVFSWSLAASQGGAPVFIVRLPAQLAEDHFVQLVFGRAKPLDMGVILSMCDATTCLGYLNVDAGIQRQIAMQSDVAVRVWIPPQMHIFETSLDGLKQAVASLK